MGHTGCAVASISANAPHRPSRQGVPCCDVTSGRPSTVTFGLTATICDTVASGLKLEVTHGPHWLRPRQYH